jgi:hypothetical protein
MRDFATHVAAFLFVLTMRLGIAMVYGFSPAAFLRGDWAMMDDPPGSWLYTLLHPDEDY